MRKQISRVFRVLCVFSCVQVVALIEKKNWCCIVYVNEFVSKRVINEFLVIGGGNSAW